MGENSLIQWTDHTFNPWRGCHKISEGCKNCYAEALVTKRQGLPVWGQDAARKVAAESTWQNPVKWNRDAARDGVKRRVFCASLADVFEDYRGPDRLAISAARERLFALILSTPNLIWLLLTKRPENVRHMVPPAWLQAFPANIWIGCTAENQDRAEQRVPHLLSVPAVVRFVSYEPALGPVDWTRLRMLPVDSDPQAYLNALTGHVAGPDDVLSHHIDWLIVGGESGPGARPFNPVWADWAVSQCKTAGVPVFVKQMGSNPTLRGGSGWGPIKDRKGGEMAEWSAQLRIRQIPSV